MKYEPPLVLVLVLASCNTGRFTGPVDCSEEPSIVGFRIEDGKATKDELFERLGPASGRYECGRIISYRLPSKSEKYSVIVREVLPGAEYAAWHHAFYNLILVFDDRGVLAEHSVLCIREDPGHRVRP